jgi:hypothetical protein
LQEPTKEEKIMSKENPEMTDDCPPSSDLMYSMLKVTQARTLVSTAIDLLAEAIRVTQNEWKWHRPDCDWHIPNEMQQRVWNADHALRGFLADLHWTQNSLRRHPAIDESVSYRNARIENEMKKENHE